MGCSLDVEWQSQSPRGQFHIVRIQRGPVRAHQQHLRFAFAKAAIGNDERENFIVMPGLRAELTGITANRGVVRNTERHRNHLEHRKREDRGTRRRALRSPGQYRIQQPRHQHRRRRQHRSDVPHILVAAEHKNRERKEPSN